MNRKKVAITVCLVLVSVICWWTRVSPPSDKNNEFKKQINSTQHRSGAESNKNDRSFSDVEERLNKRKQRLRGKCYERGYNSTFPSDVTYQKNPFLSKSLFYTDREKILMCLIPKCATRSQATFLGVCEGFGDEALRSPYQIAEKHLSPRNIKSLEEIAKKLSDYTKIVVVREPFSRLLSAFRDKIEGGGRGDTYKRKYKVIHQMKRNSTSTVNFSDFVMYLLFSKGDPQLDPHWNYYTRLCSPCDIEYTYIVHLDTIEEDMKYIVSKLRMKDLPLPPSFSSFTDVGKVNEYYSKLPPELVNQLYHKYKLDYDIFGFPPPPQF